MGNTKAAVFPKEEIRGKIPRLIVDMDDASVPLRAKKDTSLHIT
jgi:hypothetical protein